VRFVLATGNAHKLIEFRGILAPFEVLPMPAGVVLPEEGTESFAENAREKALALWRALREETGPEEGRSETAGAGDRPWCIADDSGLEVEALGWAPGVVSARYAGVDGPGADAANVARLLRELAGVAGPLARRARFVCSLCAVAPDGTELAVEGHWWGAIADSPRGSGGFGYDPAFVPDGSELTVAEWPATEKDKASHRARAGLALLEVLRREAVPGA
jgi:XTP/dITP diphosphohydrolase